MILEYVNDFNFMSDITLELHHLKQPSVHGMLDPQYFSSLSSV